MHYRSGFVDGCDGTRLHYQVCGDGPAIVACNGIGVSTFFWKYIQSHFERDYQFVMWDYRGHGRSEPPRDHNRVSIQTLAQDLAAVIDHLGISSAVLLGHSMGVQVIFEYYRNHPSRVAGLIPVLGSFGRPLDTFMNSPMSRPVFDRFVAFSRWSPRLMAFLTRLATNPTYAVPMAGLLGLCDRFYCPAEDLSEYLEHISAIDSSMLMEMALAMADHSAEDVLPLIHVPTLIVAGEHDLFTPVYLSLEMQRRIAGSELVLLRAGSHAALIEQPEVIIHRMERFFREHGFAGHDAVVAPLGQRQSSLPMAGVV